MEVVSIAKGIDVIIPYAFEETEESAKLKDIKYDTLRTEKFGQSKKQNFFSKLTTMISSFLQRGWMNDGRCDFKKICRIL